MSISGIAHINLIVPKGTLELANEFYGNTLGLTPRQVPSKQQGELAWFDIGSSGQQVHVAFGPEEVESRRHPCFQVPSAEALLNLQTRIYEHYSKGDKSAPRQADQPGQENSGSKGVEYPTRFFARDYAGKHRNRIKWVADPRNCAAYLQLLQEIALSSVYNRCVGSGTEDSYRRFCCSPG
jgi:catechol 2,3-dioxygenase-like lactoylglutathione lyase family enzyme